MTDNEEAEELANDDEFPENGLKKALVTHLISAAHVMLTGGKVCSFLIHPSVKISQHACFADKIGNYLNEIAHSHDEAETKKAFEEIYESLKETKRSIMPFSAIYAYVMEQLQEDRINILVLNSEASYDENRQYDKGINIIVGGNSLGRGVTFPKLQTVYYCRAAKSPQADTMWQHARMFGYDRDPDLMRVFLPPKLFKLFSDINQTNISIIKQIESAVNWNDIKIMLPAGVKPTRANVLDKKSVCIYSGGVNYFPFYPVNKDVSVLDGLLSAFNDGEYTVSLKLIIKILLETGAESEDDWNANAFSGFVSALLAADPGGQGILIIRRNRDIGKETGTLLSPADRSLGDSYPSDLVLTLYKITGNVNKGWDGRQIWIPNIKLPSGCAYYNTCTSV